MQQLSNEVANSRIVFPKRWKMYEEKDKKEL